MSILQDRQRYFWLGGNGDAVSSTMPEPSTYENSRITPCIDLYAYMEKFREALNLVGVDPNPENNRGDFIYIAGWLIGLLGNYNAAKTDLAFEAAGSLSFDTPSVLDNFAFELDPFNPAVKLLDVLQDKARRGVDVRVLGWVAFSLFAPDLVPIPVFGTLLINPLLTNFIQSKIGGIIKVNAQTMNSIKNLRTQSAMAKGGMLNVLGHSAGAAHVKGTIFGTKPDALGNCKAVGFTGGLDLETIRWSKYGHQFESGWDPALGRPFWHDVQAAIEGPATQGLYNHFRDMWNENLRREAKLFGFEGEKIASYVPGTQAVPDRVVNQPLLSSPVPLTHHVQSLRTIPVFKYHWYNCLPENSPVSYAPDGLFEVKAAWEKAILGSQKYIYIEDQVYWGKEVMEWVNEAIRGNPALKVILLRPGSFDPVDGPVRKEEQYLHESINCGLLGFNTPNWLTPAQRNQIRYFHLWGPSYRSSDKMKIVRVTPFGPGETEIEINWLRGSNLKAVPENLWAEKHRYLAQGGTYWAITGNPRIEPGQPLIFRLDTQHAVPSLNSEVGFAESLNIMVHAKVTIIDDKWAIIGSANVLQRSLYTDWEHAVSFMDESGAVAQFRSRLWAEHFQKQESESHLFLNLDDALGSWDPAWATANTIAIPQRPAGDKGPPYLDPIMLPVRFATMWDSVRTRLEAVVDVDARKDWGGICLPPSE